MRNASGEESGAFFLPEALFSSARCAPGRMRRTQRSLLISRLSCYYANNIPKIITCLLKQPRGLTKQVCPPASPWLEIFTISLTDPKRTHFTKSLPLIPWNNLHHECQSLMDDPFIRHWVPLKTSVWPIYLPEEHLTFTTELLDNTSVTNDGI